MESYLKITQAPYLLFHLAEAFRNLKLTKKELEKAILKKVKRTVNFAYHNTSYYHNIMKKSRIRPSEIRCLNDMKKIPTLSRDELQKNYENIIAKNIKCVYSHKTSGTLNPPIKIQYDKNYLIHDTCLLLRQLTIIGYTPRMKFAEFKEYQLENSIIRRLLNYFGFFRKLELPANSTPKEIIQKLKEFRPHFFITSLSMILTLLGEIDESMPYLTLIIGGETSTRKMREKIRDVVGFKNVLEWYNCWECGHIAYECECGNLHLNSDYNFVELLDKNGEPLSEGERGEVVITCLSNFRMPLIRYKLGDLAIYEGKCECGSNLPSIRDVIIRKNNVLKLNKKRLIFPEKILELIADLPVKEWNKLQIIQERDSSIKIFGKDIDETFLLKLSNIINSQFKVVKKNKFKKKWIPVSSRMVSF